MDKLHYDTATLSAELRSYEQRSGLSTEALVERYRSGSAPDGISGFDAFEWAATSIELARLVRSGRERHLA